VELTQELLKLLLVVQQPLPRHARRARGRAARDGRAARNRIRRPLRIAARGHDRDPDDDPDGSEKASRDQGGNPPRRPGLIGATRLSWTRGRSARGTGGPELARLFDLVENAIEPWRRRRSRLGSFGQPSDERWQAAGAVARGRRWRGRHRAASAFETE